MKKPLLLLIMSGLGMLCLRSQTIEASYGNNFAEDMAHVFENLDLAEVTTDLLLDRSMPFVEADSFDGVQLLEYNQLEINRFGLLYATFYGAALDTSALLPHPDRYMLARDSLETGDAIPLAVFHLDYHRFKQHALDSNLIFVQDSQLHDTPNRPESPYVLKKVFGATPILSAADTLDITFSLPDTLIFTNTTGIVLFEMDLDDGNGYQTVAFNQDITASYTEAGEKELLFKVTLTDSTVYYGHASFTARGTGVNANANAGANKNYSETPDDVVPIPATVSHEYGEMQIGYGCSDLGLRKPLLYVQGYFPQIGNEAPQDYQFLFEIDRYGQNIPGSSDDILDILELENYDIIYLQLSNPGDVVDRNAEIVKKAIRELNTMLADNGSQEQIIVIGASMGGLLSKYALLEMEQAGEDHNVKTLITLDTPFNGANIPVGMQFMLLHLLNLQVSFVDGLISFTTTSLGGFVPVIGQTTDAINGGFVQEALIYNIFEMPNLYQQLPNNLTGLTLTKPEHTSFYASLEAMGDLQDCDHVALSNGSSIGEGQSFGPGDKLLRINGWAGDIYEELGVGEFWAEILEGVGIVFLGTHISFDFNVYALPDNPSSYTKVYKGETFVSVIFGAIAVNASSFEGKVKETVPYDSAPGGTISFPDGGLPDFINVYHPSFCFVPTVSSLDITSPENEDLAQDLSDVPGVTAAGLTTADRYDASTDDGFQSAHNQHHASLNSTNIPFLMAELASDDELPDLPVNANGELVLGNRTYNYGDANGHFDPNNPTIRHTPHQLKQTLWVENTGKLWVNREDRISFTDDTANPANTTDSYFDLVLLGQDGCELGDMELHIENGGSMKIGAIAVQNTADVYVMEGAKVFVQHAGELILERSSNVIVENGGEVILASGGLYQTHGDSETQVREGGVFRVNNGGILRIVDESKLLVEPGGQLILEDGAVVQLWDATQPDGLANIHIQGELVINGGFDFNGSGFFQFDAGHVLAIASGVDFEIDGNGQGKRFIRLNQLARLDIGGHAIKLSNGKVEYERGSSILLGDQGSALMIDVDFVDLNQPGEADALLAHSKPKFVTVAGCHFEGLVTGIAVNGATGISVADGYTRYLRVSGSTFNDCEYAVVASSTPFVEITGSDFTTASAISLYAISLRDVDGAAVGNSNVSGYSDDRDGAVSLYNVPDYNMVGGSVSGNALGILATGQSNINMTSRATVSSNTTGIEMYGGDAFGVLTMDCARLLDNGIGVLGTDVTLNIDASGELKPNHFRTTTGSPLFQICYNSLAGFFSDPIDAKDNFWEGPKDYLIYDPTLPGYASCSHYFGNLSLLTTPEAIDQECNSGPGDPNDPAPDPDLVDVNFTGDDPNCLDVVQQVLYDNYWSAYDAYLDETHLVASHRALSDSLYALVAAVPDNIGQGYSVKCQQLIHIARSRVDVPSGPESFILNNSNSATEQMSREDWVRIFPNPAREAITVELDQGKYFIKVFNQYGVIVDQSEASESIALGVGNWPNGLYFIEVYNRMNSQKMGRKVIVQQ